MSGARSTSPGVRPGRLGERVRRCRAQVLMSCFFVEEKDSLCPSLPRIFRIFLIHDTCSLTYTQWNTDTRAHGHTHIHTRTHAHTHVYTLTHPIWYVLLMPNLLTRQADGFLRQGEGKRHTGNTHTGV